MGVLVHEHMGACKHLKAELILEMKRQVTSPDLTFRNEIYKLFGIQNMFFYSPVLDYLSVSMSNSNANFLKTFLKPFNLVA